MKWRLGLDLGTSSLGWAAFELDANGEVLRLLDLGVRIFPDGREPSKGGRVGDSSAVERRLARGMRRNREHTTNRRKYFLQSLVDLGLFPENKADRKALEHLCPYELRSRAVDEALSGPKLARALFHLGTRRGYKSNRKTESNDEKGVVKQNISRLRDQMGKRTLGQYLYDRLTEEVAKEQKGGRRASIRFHAEEGDLFPERAMYAEEFDAIIKRQAPHFPGITQEQWQGLRESSILFQHPLKPVERGKCSIHPDEHRAHQDQPTSHDYRIAAELANLRWRDERLVEHTLDPIQREAIREKLMEKKTFGFSSMRKLKGPHGERLFPESSRFNLESERRKTLKGNITHIEMRSEKWIGGDWDKLSLEDRDKVLEILHEAEDDETAVKLLTEKLGLPNETALRLSDYPTSSNTTNLSLKAMRALTQIILDQGITYDDAVLEYGKAIGEDLHHSRREAFELRQYLPYYGEMLQGSMLGAHSDADRKREPEQHFGKINNPTVHIALNQLRQLTNRLIERFDPPSEIHLELTRDLKLPRKMRDELNSTYAKNEKANKARITLYQDTLGTLAEPSARDIKKIKLFEELSNGEMTARCVFSGRVISAAMLFNAQVEIEHILPFSRTLDDSLGNLTLAVRDANRLKGNQTPFEAFGADQHRAGGEYVWADIAERVQRLPASKRWRFTEQAMERFEADGGFIARQLTDTAYMSRSAARYLSAICPPNKILSNPGKLTAIMRGKWGLPRMLRTDNQDKKNRGDHRHHAIDAATVALVTRSVLQRVSSAHGADGVEKIDVPDLDPQIRDQIQDRLNTLVVSYKPDHPEQGKLYKETAYGLVDEERRDQDLPSHNLVTRKQITALSENELSAIRDPRIRAEVLARWEQASAAKLKLDKVLAQYGQETGVKRVRLLVKNQTAVPIPSAPYKAYVPDAFMCCDIWEMPKGKKGKWHPTDKVWQGKFWSYVETRGQHPDKNKGKPHPAARFVMRLFKNDMVQMMTDDGPQILRVAGFSTTNNRLDLRPHLEADSPQKYVSINILKGRKLVRIKSHPDGSSR
jgi:CRISPR-associated endonuclease Csn1